MKILKKVHMRFSLLLVLAISFGGSALQAQAPGQAQNTSSISSTEAGMINFLDSLYVGAGGVWFIVLISIYFLVKKERSTSQKTL